MPISVEQRNGETWKMKVAATVFEPLLEELPPSHSYFRPPSEHQSSWGVLAVTDPTNDFGQVHIWSYHYGHMKLSTTSTNGLHLWFSHRSMVIPPHKETCGILIDCTGACAFGHHSLPTLCGQRLRRCCHRETPKTLGFCDALLPQDGTMVFDSWVCEMHFFSTTARNMESVYCGWVYHNGHQLEGYL